MALMTYAPPPPMQPMPPMQAPSPAWDAATIAVGVVTIVAPLLGVALKLPTGGWLMVILLLSGLLWAGGYIVLVLAVSLGMLRRRGPLRAGGARIRSMIWALMTSIGVVVLGFTLVDGGDTRESIQSTLTLLLGSPESPSPAHSVSEAIGWVAAGAWAIGYLGLVVEWIAATARARQARQPIAPQVAPPRVG